MNYSHTSSLSTIMLLLSITICLLLCSTHTRAQPLQLPQLPYEYNALEPFISEQIMKAHHLGHHAAYTERLNTILLQLREHSEVGKTIAKLGIDAIIKNFTQLSKGTHSIPSSIWKGIREQGGGYVNHALFWTLLSPPILPLPAPISEENMANGPVLSPPTTIERLPIGELAEAITKQYGGYQEFRSEFVKTASSVFGSGWVWTIINGTTGNLAIVVTSNQDNPMMESQGHSPVLALDLWEHSYYLQYLFKRNEYITAFWKIVNWEEGNLLYLKGLAQFKRASVQIHSEL